MNKKPVHGDYIQGSPSNHPGMPVGEDRVPAWLAPNEFVVNEEATRMYGPQIKAMNDHGRAIQAQQSDMQPPVPTDALYLEAGGLVNWLGSLFGQPEATPAQQPVPPQAPMPAAPQAPMPAAPQAPMPAAPQAPMPVAQMVAPQMTAPVPDQALAVPQNQAPPAPSYDLFSGDNWNQYSSAVASLESQGKEDPYSIYGGANNHYVGKYQLGASAIADASRIMGLETTPTREQVRQNPALQEQMFNAFTKGNHYVLMQNSPEYRSMDPAAQQRVLGYAHNQGAGGAVKFLRTGEAGSDAFGTSGTKYMERIAKAQGGEWTAPNNPAGRHSANQLGIPSQPYGSPPAEAPSQSGVGFSRVTPQMPDMITGGPDFPSLWEGGYRWSPEDGHAAISPGNPPAFIPQGVSGQPNAVFQDPAFQVMAQREGMAPNDYWNSLHPEAQTQHLSRVTAPPVPTIEGSGVAAANPDMVPGSVPPVMPEGSVPDPRVANLEAYKEYGASRAEATGDLQQELDSINMQLQTITADAPAYPMLQERKASILGMLGRNDPAYSGSAIPSPEVLGQDILVNQNEVANADAEIAMQTRAIQEAGARGDTAGVTAAENALIAAHKQKTDAMLTSADQQQTRQANALEDQARLNDSIMQEVQTLDTAIENARTPEAKEALTQRRDDIIESGTVPQMAPAGQADNLPAIDRDTADSLKSTAPDPAAVTAKVDEAKTIAEQDDEPAVATTLTAADAEKAGDKAATADPKAFGGALGFVKDFFGDMFDAKELKRMAILYLGARLSGASHGASLGFAGESYLTRIDAKQTAYDKVAAAGTYTKDSIEIFKKTRDYNDLMLKATPVTKTGVLATFYDDKGREVRAEQVKQGDNKYYVNANGQQINPLLLTETKPEDRNAAVQEGVGVIEPMLTSLRDTFSKDEEGNFTNEIIPEIASQKLAEFTVAEGVPLEEMGGVIEAAYHDMLNDRTSGRKKRDLIPYIRQNIIRQQTGGNAGAFVVKPGENGAPHEYVDPAKLQVLNRRGSQFLADSGMQGTTMNLANQVYTAALTEWNKLPAPAKDKYENRAADGTNGYYEFVDEWLQSQGY